MITVTPSSKSAPLQSVPTGAAPARLNRHHSTGIHRVAVEAKPAGELHLTLTPLPGESVEYVARRLASALAESQAEVVRVIAFGSCVAGAAFASTLRNALGDPGLPLTWVEGASLDGHALAGVQVHAITGAEVRQLRVEHGTQARIWQDATATHCVVSGTSIGETASFGGQTAQALTSLHATLARAGMEVMHLARTWFFLDDILSWYGDFNRARNEIFARTGLRSGGLPASTGVSGRNPAGVPLSQVAWAVKPHNANSPALCVVPSPLQCSAPSYGSAFSRAVELQANGCRRLLVSGTASIAPDGITAHAGDPQAQVALTMRVVERILTSRGMNWPDVSRATAYFKSLSVAPFLEHWLAQHDLTGMPLVKARCDICRDDLLFEIELDAIRTS